MMEFKINLANMIIRICGIHDTLREYCKEYIITDKNLVEDFSITVTPADIQLERRSEDKEKSDNYMEIITTLLKIADELPDRNKLLMHGAVVAWKKAGYIFTAPSGTGKTTHVRLWKQYLGSDVEIINGDKPVIEVTENEIIAYGTPWAGKERLQKNSCVPVKGICFLRQGDTNRIHKLNKREALPLLLPQIYIMTDSKKAGRTLELFSKILELVPVYEFSCNISDQAVKCSFEALTMKDQQEEKV